VPRFRGIVRDGQMHFVLQDDVSQRHRGFDRRNQQHDAADASRELATHGAERWLDGGIVGQDRGPHVHDEAEREVLDANVAEDDAGGVECLVGGEERARRPLHPDELQRGMLVDAPKCAVVEQGGARQLGQARGHGIPPACVGCTGRAERGSGAWPSVGASSSDDRRGGGAGRNGWRSAGGGMRGGPVTASGPHHDRQDVCTVMG
jgi:hypothetical protein